MNLILPTQDCFGVKVDSAKFFGLNDVSNVKRSLDINLTDRSYRPKNDDLRSDWVASVAAPAFNLLAAEGYMAERFCTIGTGAGLDALAAVEILSSNDVFVTDLHDDVVSRAVTNISTNLRKASVQVRHAVGDLLQPVVASGYRADLLYENLPNIPLSGNADLSDGQTSSTFIAERAETLPEFAVRYLLALHHIVIKDAASVLRPNGRILSSVGGRAPLQAILQLASASGHQGRILLYTWKQQSEPEDVIGGYAHWEACGHGPFAFYPVDVLNEVFRTTRVTGSDASRAVEKALLPHAISAEKALESLHDGVPIGHTVAVLESTPAQNR